MTYRAGPEPSSKAFMARMAAFDEYGIDPTLVQTLPSSRQTLAPLFAAKSFEPVGVAATARESTKYGLTAAQFPTGLHELPFHLAKYAMVPLPAGPKLNSPPTY